MSDLAERLAQLDAEIAEARAAQEKLDDDEFYDRAVEYGKDRVRKVPLPYDAFSKDNGHPTFAIVRVPKPVEWKRLQSDMERANNKTGAAHLLGRACLLSPSKEVYEQILERYPGIHEAVSLAAVHLAQGQKAEEGKG